MENCPIKNGRLLSNLIERFSLSPPLLGFSNFQMNALDSVHLKIGETQNEGGNGEIFNYKWKTVQFNWRFLHFPPPFWGSPI